MVVFLYILKCFEYNIIMVYYEWKLIVEVGFGLICWFYLVFFVIERGEIRMINYIVFEIMFGFLGKIEGML